MRLRSIYLTVLTTVAIGLAIGGCQQDFSPPAPESTAPSIGELQRARSESILQCLFEKGWTSDNAKVVADNAMSFEVENEQLPALHADIETCEDLFPLIIE